MDPRLLWVTQSGSVDALHSLIQNEPCILQNADVLPFTHTPLHEASSTGKIDLAMALMILKPSFANKLNADGLSPLHLAVENHHVELALELAKFSPCLVRIRGIGGMTSLHLVVQKGDVDLLTEFLLVCPESIRDANVKGETALHITVMNDRYEELKVLRGWLQRLRKVGASSTENHVLNRCDREGNTALHLAAYKNDHQAVKQLLKSMSLNRNIQNRTGMTALDALRSNGPRQMNRDTEKLIQNAGGKRGDSLSKVKKTSVFLRKSVTFSEYCFAGIARYRSGITDGTRNTLLVIAGLIISATYQTVPQPLDKDKYRKLSVAEFFVDFVMLWGLNTIAFLLSIATTFILLPVGKGYTWWYIFISGPLVCSYAVSLYMKFHIFPVVILLMLLVVALGILIYLLVLYVKWKRTTQKKTPKLKSELISEVLNTIV